MYLIYLLNLLHLEWLRLLGAYGIAPVFLLLGLQGLDDIL